MGGGVDISFWEKFQGAFLSVVYFDQGASASMLFAGWFHHSKCLKIFSYLLLQNMKDVFMQIFRYFDFGDFYSIKSMWDF